MEIIEQIEAWKDVRVRMVALAAALKSAQVPTSYTYDDRERLRKLALTLDEMSKEARSIPLHLLHDEARAITAVIRRIKSACRDLGIDLGDAE
jgi:hypothetical protein